MNTENLHELINRYEAKLDFINNSENDEVFKWRAVRCFQDVWFTNNLPFNEKFRAATKECSVLVDNGQVSPTNGIVKMAEQEPEEVERLFTDVLFADDDGDLNLRQEHMETFMDGIEAVRQKCFPSFWKYSQDRHSVSTYLALFAPDDNYIYKYSEAEDFAKCIEYGRDIGSGQYFKLAAYYDMCDLVVDALRQHESLLKKHQKYCGSDCYEDESLHLLAFDLIYCARSYNLYSGMSFIPKSESIKAYKQQEQRQQEEMDKQAQITAIEDHIRALELRITDITQISLLNVQVTHRQYGTGTVIAQNANKITVQFESVEKAFIINKKFAARPTFEDDEEIVTAFTEYDDAVRQITLLKKQLERIK